MCDCEACRYERGHTPEWEFLNDGMRFHVCETCGNKRCPHAEDHRFVCTGSNEPNQWATLAPGEEERRFTAHFVIEAQEPTDGVKAYVIEE